LADIKQCNELVDVLQLLIVNKMFKIDHHKVLPRVKVHVHVQG